MRVAEALLIVALGMGVTGCARKPKTVAAAPAPPAPAPPAPDPPPPLSIPQTNVQLPPPQPLTPEAIATTQLPTETTPAPTPPRTPVTRPKPQPRPAEPPPATMPQTTPPTIEPGRAPITEVLPAGELKRLQDEASQRSQEARRLIDQIPPRRRQQDTRVRRIETFLKQAADAERRGDMRQASELAGRALVLARELKP